MSDVNGMEKEFPLQMAADVPLVIVGAGFTVTVIIFAGPEHPSFVDFGVT